MRSALDVLGAIEGIRAATAGNGYAPHKPLLLLLALARVQRGEERLVEFATVEPLLKSLLKEFGPTNSELRRNLPFWHLHTDRNGLLWDLSGPSALLKRAAGHAPSITELRSNHVAGGFHPDVDACLRQTPGLVAAAARRLLDKFFPFTLHGDILDAIGLDIESSYAAQELSADYSGLAQTKRKRSAEFRDRVLRAYEYRCCVCGFDLRIGHLPAGLEAAHIMWHHIGGPDIEPNGLSLCALHHKLFDLGAFTVVPEGYRVVFSQHAMSGARGLGGALQHHGQAIHLPPDTGCRPAQEFLAWNVQQVFKRPARPVLS